jgi:hypothetical protein
VREQVAFAGKGLTELVAELNAHRPASADKQASNRAEAAAAAVIGNRGEPIVKRLLEETAPLIGAINGANGTEALPKHTAALQDKLAELAQELAAFHQEAPTKFANRLLNDGKFRKLLTK